MSTTVIFSNAGDTDCETLRCLWKGISDLTVVEITPDSDYEKVERRVDELVSCEEDTIIFAGHGTGHGLLFPRFESGVYVLHDNNVGLIKAKRIICCWCYASTFVKRYGLHNCFSTSMFISNINEAYDNCITQTDSDEIMFVGHMFYTELNKLIKDDTPVCEWVSMLKETTSSSYVDMFNRDGLVFQK